MTQSIRDLEQKLEHASAIAACSIGQPDRAEHLAYREEIAAQLQAAKTQAVIERVTRLAQQWENAIDMTTERPSVVSRAFAAELRRAIDG